MNEKFYELSKEKQDRLINGGIQVFALNGYKHASTDEMVKVAGVSKGLWFHYFGNKIGLYYFVCAYGVRYALMEMNMKMDSKEYDYFKVMENFEKVKLSLAEKYPYLPLLLINMQEEDNEEALEVLGDLIKQYKDQTQEMIVRTYPYTFKDKVDPGKINDMMQATFDKRLKEMYKVPGLADTRYMDDILDYISFVKNLVSNSL